MHFAAAGHGTAIRDSEVAKARWAMRRKRRGSFVRRVAAPVVDDADARLKNIGEQFVSGAGERLNAESRRAQRRLVTGLAVGGTAGIGGGMTLGAYGQRKVNERKVRKDDYELRTPKITDYPAGSYNYLLPTMREDIAGIPMTRRNPISPLAQVAAADQIARGYTKVKSRNPFFRQSRRRKGFQEILIGQSMSTRGIGDAL